MKLFEAMWEKYNQRVREKCGKFWKIKKKLKIIV